MKLIVHLEFSTSSLENEVFHSALSLGRIYWSQINEWSTIFINESHHGNTSKIIIQYWNYIILIFHHQFNNYMFTINKDSSKYKLIKNWDNLSLL